MEIMFTVPLVPPSVNHYKLRTRKGVTYVSEEAKAFKKAVAICGRGHSIHANAYEATVWIYLGKGQKGDVDNFAKCVLDGLAEAGIIHSDAAIDLLHIGKFRDWSNPRTEITVKTI